MEGFDALPEQAEMLDKNDWKDREKLEKKCELCQCTFGNKLTSDRNKHHCRRCGAAICHQCCQNSKYISKNENSLTDKICDRCDFEIANPFINDWADETYLRQKKTGGAIAKEKIRYDKLIIENSEKARNYETEIQNKKQ